MKTLPILFLLFISANIFSQNATNKEVLTIKVRKKQMILPEIYDSVKVSLGKTYTGTLSYCLDTRRTFDNLYSGFAVRGGTNRLGIVNLNNDSIFYLKLTSNMKKRITWWPVGVRLEHADGTIEKLKPINFKQK